MGERILGKVRAKASGRCMLCGCEGCFGRGLAEHLQGVIEALHMGQFAARRYFHRHGRTQDMTEPQAKCFTNALFQAGDVANFAAETDFADGTGAQGRRRA
jgi:hypothetical protein